MIRLVKITDNAIEVIMSDRGILFSYGIPVAAYIQLEDETRYYRTDKFHSNTTGKHINTWLSEHNVKGQEVPQHILDNLDKFI